jgi:hypothetical protein
MQKRVINKNILKLYAVKLHTQRSYQFLKQL